MALRKVALVALLAGIAAETGAANAQEFKLNAFYFGPNNTTFTKTRWYPYLDMIEKASGGRIKFNRMHGFSILPPPKIYDGVVRGIVHLAYAPTSFTPGRFKRTELLGLPGIARDRFTGSKIANDLLRSHLQEDYPDAKAPALDYSGPRELWTTKTAIHRISDLKGMRIRFDGLEKQLALKAVGAVPTSTKPPERFVSMERGLVQGTIEVSTSVEPFGVQELVRFRNNFNMGASVTVLVWNKQIWQKFDSDLRAKLTEVTYQGALDPMAKLGQKSDVSLAREVWAKKYGLKNIEPSEEQRAAWQRVIKPLWTQMADNLEKKGINGRAIIAEIQKLQTKYGEPHYVPYVYP